MRELKLFPFRAALAFVACFASCDTETPPPAPEPRDPNDITGYYSVDYAIYLDDSPLPAFTSFGDDYSSAFAVIGGNGTDQTHIMFYPDPRIIQFFFDAEEDILICPVEIRGEAGNLYFRCPELIDNGHGELVPSRSEQRLFALTAARPVVRSDADMTVTATVVAKKEVPPGGYYYDYTYGGYGGGYDNAGLFHDLDMTVDLVPLTPNDLFGKLTIIINSR